MKHKPNNNASVYLDQFQTVDLDLADLLEEMAQLLRAGSKWLDLGALSSYGETHAKRKKLAEHQGRLLALSQATQQMVKHCDPEYYSELLAAVAKHGDK